MDRTSLQKLAWPAAVFALACAAAFAQENTRSESSDSAFADNETLAANPPDILFTNLTRTAGMHYDTANASIIAGKAVRGQTEEWAAMRFRPSVSGQATVLSAAVGYVSGTKLVTLGIYSDSGGQVGTLLPGGVGSTSVVPDFGECCKLATVTLTGQGVTLTANTNYWLVAGPDDTNAPDFYALWQVSNFGTYASLAPPFSWDPQSSGWLAGEIRGTRSEDTPSTKTSTPIQETQQANDSAANIIIFTNLDRTSTQRYLLGTGLPIYGNNVLFEPEVWEALPFTPKTDVHVKTVGAAIAYIKGTRKVNIGIYSDNGGVPGTVLPGAQSSTIEIPDSGDCCELTEVRFPGAGIALSKGVKYWVVASPDNLNAPDFDGVWQGATISLSAYEEPEEFNNWTSFDGDWVAAEIRGTNL